MIEALEPTKIKMLLDKINRNPESVAKLAVDFAADSGVDLSEFIIDDIMSSQFPLAIDPLLISENTFEEKLMRAETILDIWLPDLINKRFLDFGCAEGQVPFLASKTAQIAVGYDIDNSGWDKISPKDNLILLNDIEQLTEYAPFDIILVFDVLDHLINDDPINVLKKLKSLLRPSTGRIYIRLHPWTSRHATHLYRTLNKAFCHMLLTEEQLKTLGHIGLPTLKITKPIITYDNWFNDSGLKIFNREIIKEPIEEYFKEGLVSDIIKSHWKTSNFSMIASDDTKTHSLITILQYNQ